MAQTSVTTYIIHPTPAIQESAELALGIFRTFLDRNVSKAFTFHRTNAKASQFQRWADLLINAYWESEVGRSAAAPEVLRVSSAMTASERQRALERSRGARPSILANSRLLATGVDVPEVEGGDGASVGGGIGRVWRQWLRSVVRAKKSRAPCLNPTSAGSPRTTTLNR